MKAGSTALHEHLSLHPGVYMSRRKEPNYFAVSREGCLPDWVDPNDRMARRQMVLTRGEYQRLFRRAHGRVCGESSILYLNDPEAAKRAAAANPAFRAIALLREPAERAYSAWQFLQRLGREPLGFEEALDAEPDRIMGPGYHYVGIGRYATALSNWRRALGADQVLAIEYSKFVSDPDGVVEDVCKFIGVDAAALPSDVAQRNTGGGVPGSLLQQRVVAVIRWVAADRVPARISHPLNRGWQKLFMDRVPPLDPRLSDRIRSELLDETTRLEDMLGWDLSSWKPGAGSSSSA